MLKHKTMALLSFVALLSALIIGTVNAADYDLNLPSTIIRIEVYDGTESYFLTKLMDVPEGYDVSNGTYLGWCIDTRVEMARSPATHYVKLYSSLNPPGELASEEYKWDRVNYILNHKQGNATDIQQAIWYFVNIDGNYTPTSQTAWNIINDALANGEGYVPAYGEKIAVICYPQYVLPTETQISIIEITNTIVPEFPAFQVILIAGTIAMIIIAAYKRRYIRKLRQ